MINEEEEYNDIDEYYDSKVHHEINEEVKEIINNHYDSKVKLELRINKKIYATIIMILLS